MKILLINNLVMIKVVFVSNVAWCFVLWFRDPEEWLILSVVPKI